LEPALAALARRHLGLSLRVICSEPYQSASIPVENVPWSLAHEVANLRSLDIGLMPLDDDPWTRGKCGYKALQYMAVGIPVVCSPVGMNAEIVTEGETGLLAADLASWERQLSRLVESPGLRQQLGAAGQRAALRQYSLGRMAPRLADLLRSASKVSGPSRRMSSG
jgi:glycosyltransferase involved in cell wall biosynthesis